MHVLGRANSTLNRPSQQIQTLSKSNYFYSIPNKFNLFCYSIMMALYVNNTCDIDVRVHVCYKKPKKTGRDYDSVLFELFS